MNYLAHALLSFDNKNILAGNLISDFVKGKQILNYNDEVVAGIKLHRAIDTFTDQHPIVKSTKQIFKTSYGHYSGAFLDVAFDHFVANDPNFFLDDNALEGFADKTYRDLEQFYAVLDDNITSMLINMRKYNWLYHYRSIYGIEKSFGGLVYKTRYVDNAKDAIDIFHYHYEDLAVAYKEFMPDLYSFSKDFVHSYTY